MPPRNEAALAGQLAENIKHLRDKQSLTQQQISARAKIPRATWANLESGAANPTLAVLYKVAFALQVSVEELISTPRSTTRHIRAESLATRKQGGVVVRKLLPDPIPGLSLERLDFPAASRLVGVPHNPGTRIVAARKCAARARQPGTCAWRPRASRPSREMAASLRPEGTPRRGGPVRGSRTPSAACRTSVAASRAAWPPAHGSSCRS